MHFFFVNRMMSRSHGNTFFMLVISTVIYEYMYHIVSAGNYLALRIVT